MKTQSIPVMKMMKTSIALVAAALAAYLGWGLLNPQTPAPRESTASGSIEEHLDRLIAIQQAQAARLDRLEATFFNTSNKASHGIAGTVATKDRRHKEENLQTPAQRSEKLQEAINQMELEFQSESVSSGWASTTEKIIAGAFSSTSLAGKGAPVPSAHRASCRTFSCRIQATYANDVEADIAEAFLTSDIAGQLPKAKHFRFMAPDGTVQLILYANTGSTRR